MNNLEKKNKFILKAQKVHGNKIDFSKVEYISSKIKVCLYCKEKDRNGIEHGEYWQTPAACVRGDNCPKCGNEKRGKHMNINTFIKKERKIHGDKYLLDKVTLADKEKKICLVCPIHGDFWQLPSAHLRGEGCPKCKGRGFSQVEIIHRFNKVHGNFYNYSESKITKLKSRIKIICPIHGAFYQTPQKHLNGQGCKLCGNKRKNINRILSFEEFVERSNKIHNGKYNYVPFVSTNEHNKVTIICPQHGEFIQCMNDHLQGHGCQKCGITISKAEDEIFTYLQSIGIRDIIRNERTIIKPYEIDLYSPSYKIGIEFDGLKWHSDEFKNNSNYHLFKTEECNKNGVDLMHIFEDEYLEHKDIVLNRLNYAFNYQSNNLICNIFEISEYDAENFLTKNHLQGFKPSTIYLGAYSNNRLLGVMSFDKCDNYCNFEITRFAVNEMKIMYIKYGIVAT